MPNVNDAAPDFTLLDHNRNAHTLSDYKGKKVVLAFYPAAFTGVCQKEMCTFQASMATLNDANAEVFGISVDAPFSNAAFASQNGVEFPLLSDYDREAVAKYGVELHDFAGMKGYTASQRAVFVVGEDGEIVYKWVGENPGVEPNYDEVLAAL